MVFGRSALTHPLMVEAIETLFVPVAIHNNKKGYDATILKRYEEPSWNNPVTRFVDADGRDVIPRKDRVWTTAGVARRMQQALEKHGKKVPRWFRDFVSDSVPPKKGFPRPGADVVPTLPRLERSLLRYLPLTPRQAARIDKAFEKDKPVTDQLSPRQRALLERIETASKKKGDALKGLARPAKEAELAQYLDALGKALKKAGA